MKERQILRYIQLSFDVAMREDSPFILKTAV